MFLTLHVTVMSSAFFNPSFAFSSHFDTGKGHARPFGGCMHLFKPICGVVGSLSAWQSRASGVESRLRPFSRVHFTLSTSSNLLPHHQNMHVSWAKQIVHKMSECLFMYTWTIIDWRPVLSVHWPCSHSVGIYCTHDPNESNWYRKWLTTVSVLKEV